MKEKKIMGPDAAHQLHPISWSRSILEIAYLSQDCLSTASSHACRSVTSERNAKSSLFRESIALNICAQLRSFPVATC